MYMSVGLFVVGIILVLAIFVYMKEDPKLTGTPDKVVLFFRPTCPSCREFKPTWDDVVKSMPNTKFEEVNTDESGSEEKEKIYGVEIKTVPAMFLIKDGKATQYSGPRDKASLMKVFK